ncbi:hypothetical protein WR25_23355 [Diploscapter pachys]|uniref:N-acetyltransferase domain-containing protein n=1 Tax=Diploscapter pachys TaxID=2018661 RepID=A0A2A2K1X8_9BILA|nr:hypothetical protein WR25_23355 [Diploscapter pachys]
MTVLSKSMLAARTMAKTIPVFNPAANVLYHIAKTKMDREPCFNMTKLCAQDDEHFKALGCSVEDATPYFDRYVRDALRYSYSMIAYDAEVPVGMSLVTVRNREKELDGMNALGAAPIRTNYTPLDDVLKHCQDIFWKSNPTVYRVWMTSMLYVLPDYRRFGVSSMMLSLQYEKLRELVKKGESVDGMISIPTSNASKQQFLKLGYTEIYTV